MDHSIMILHIIYLIFCEYGMPVDESKWVGEHWKQSCHDANFVITGGTAGCKMTTVTWDAASDNKVGIMTTPGFR